MVSAGRIPGPDNEVRGFNAPEMPSSGLFGICQSIEEAEMSKPVAFPVRHQDGGRGNPDLHFHRDTLIRAMAGAAILAVPGSPSPSPCRPASRWWAPSCSRWASCVLYLLGSICWTGVFVLTPLAWMDKRPGVNLLAGALATGVWCSLNFAARSPWRC